MKIVRAIVLACLALLIGLSAALAQGTGAEPRPLASDPVGAGQYLQVLVGLVLVVVVIFGIAWFMRRFGHLPTGGQGVVRMVGGLSMGQRERIVLLQVGETQLLVGVAPGYLRTLHVLEQPVSLPAAATRNRGESFADRLQSALKRGVKS
jgi:flagellar protein FliO/FliZ